MPVVLTNTHPAISAHNHFDNDESFKQLNSQVNDRAYQTAFGTLLYSQSEQFRRSEKASLKRFKKIESLVFFKVQGSVLLVYSKRYYNLLAKHTYIKQHMSMQLYNRQEYEK